VSGLSDILDRIRGIDLERTLGLRPASPRVAIELDGEKLSFVRVKPRRGNPPVLEGHQIRTLDDAGVPATLFDTQIASTAVLSKHFRELFESSGIRPGRISVVLPDNLAKVSLLQLPERPPSRKQLIEVIRFKLHRAVPFRLSEAAMTFQVLPGEGRSVSVLVALVPRLVVERYEQALESIGARPGMIDLCTPNLLNLCRERIVAAGADGADVALLNCTHAYFTLMIVRQGRLIFFRCKSAAVAGAKGGAAGAPTNGALGRELAGSLSYYQEKLEGRGVGTLLVRSVDTPIEAIAGYAERLGIQSVEPVDPVSRLSLTDGYRVEPEMVQFLAPAIGAVVGRN